MSISNNIRTGQLGEDIACRYLKEKGFTIIKRNYSKKWGEIDIVSQKEGKTHFIEVKSGKDTYSPFDPEQNLHQKKLTKLLRVFESYSLEKGTSLHNPTFDWQFDAIIVLIDFATKKARIKYIDNIIVS